MSDAYLSFFGFLHQTPIFVLSASVWLLKEPIVYMIMISLLYIIVFQLGLVAMKKCLAAVQVTHVSSILPSHPVIYQF